MKILKSWLQNHIVEILPSDEAIEHAFILKSSEVESVEKIKVDGKDDTVFDLKVLPDRAHYMLSHRGVAYDLSAILNLTLKSLKTELPEKSHGASSGDEVSVKVESKLCNRYSATMISNIQNGASPAWLQNSLEAIGARSINAIVDATNYAMFDTGQPLHAFDADKVVGGITVRFAKDGEVMKTLPGKDASKEIVLKSHHLIIADDKGPLAIAGVKGGRRAEVDLNTKNIILESASFNPTSVRRTSFEVGIRNDASKRFENEITSRLTEKGVSVFLDIIEKISPNCQIGKMSDVHERLPDVWNVIVNHKHIESILNFKISEKRVMEILEKLECKVQIQKENSDTVYKVTPPFERLDLIIAEDIIDEIGRIEGLDKVVSVLPSARNNHEFSAGFIISEKIKDFFVEKWFSEIQTRTFTEKGDIEVAYPMASDKSFLRTSLRDNVLGAITLSEKNAPLLDLDKIQIFEIGKTFPKSGERLDLCVAINYVKKIKNKDAVIKSELEALVKQLETDLGTKCDAKIEGNCAYVTDIDKLDVKINSSKFIGEKGSREKFKEFSNEPFIVRDIAVFVGESVEADKVWEIIENKIKDAGALSLLVKHSLFDTFKKDGRISYAFRMVFQSMDRTLTDVEINNVMENIYSAMKEKGWEVR